MQFEIVNPSDAYTIKADDLQVAAVAVCLLGNGQYMLKGLDEDKGQEVPFFFFGGADEWFTEKFGMSYEDTATQTFKNRSDSLARALESVTLVGSYQSSLNDIGGRALTLARTIRDYAKSTDAATEA